MKRRREGIVLSCNKLVAFKCLVKHAIRMKFNVNRRLLKA